MSSGKRIIDGLVDAASHARGGMVGVREQRYRVPDEINVQSVRQKLGLTQQQFAMQFGFSLATVRTWEQGIRVPPGPARVLLLVVDKEPEAVRRALAAA
jgi:putative transcriptional regulator